MYRVVCRLSSLAPYQIKFALLTHPGGDAVGQAHLKKMVASFPYQVLGTRTVIFGFVIYRVTWKDGLALLLQKYRGGTFSHASLSFSFQAVDGVYT